MGEAHFGMACTGECRFCALATQVLLFLRSVTQCRRVAYSRSFLVTTWQQSRFSRLFGCTWQRRCHLGCPHLACALAHSLSCCTLFSNVYRWSLVSSTSANSLDSQARRTTVPATTSCKSLRPPSRLAFLYDHQHWLYASYAQSCGISHLCVRVVGTRRLSEDTKPGEAWPKFVPRSTRLRRSWQT
jgi:hypothetical protein